MQRLWGRKAPSDGKEGFIKGRKFPQLMVTAFDIEPVILISKVAEDLKTKITAPEWARFVKTGSHVERPPQQKDWYHVRAASLLRRVYTQGPVGIERLRTVYGGRKNRGAKPKHFRQAGGKVIRKLLQDLEALKLIKKGKKGREITPAGQKYLDGIAKSLKK